MTERAKSPFADTKRLTAHPREMRRVVMESPYAGDVAANLAYGRACIRDCLLREESPVASHLLYTQEGILDDLDPVERAQGINAGHAWMHGAHAVVVYTDRGISSGMIAGINVAEFFGIPVERRTLPGWSAVAGEAAAKVRGE
jgi:hypothetical protein